MRVALLTCALSMLSVHTASGQVGDAGETVGSDRPDGSEETDGYVALSADQEAQSSLTGFRAYLERTRDDDISLYETLDARLDGLEERIFVADVLFWTATAIGAATVLAAIPVLTEVDQDAGYAMMIAGASAFVLGVIIQAIVRPGHSDLLGLIDLHDRELGRR